MDSANNTTPPIPPKPEPKDCPGGCGKKQEPEFVPPVAFNGGKVMGWSNRWTFTADMCAECKARIEQEQDEKRRAAGREARLAKLEAVLGGPKPAEEFTFEKFVVTPGVSNAYRACKAFMPKVHNLYLFGQCGGGKTHLATALAREKYLDGLSVLVFKPGPFMRSLRKKDPHDQDAILKRYSMADVFVLDDLGVGEATEFYASMVYELTDMRENLRRNGLVYTSNLPLEELAKKFEDDRLTSRIAGLCGEAGVIRLDAEDHRVKRARSGQ